MASISMASKREFAIELTHRVFRPQLEALGEQQATPEEWRDLFLTESRRSFKKENARKNPQFYGGKVTGVFFLDFIRSMDLEKSASNFRQSVSIIRNVRAYSEHAVSPLDQSIKYPSADGLRDLIPKCNVDEDATPVYVPVGLCPRNWFHANNVGIEWPFQVKKSQNKEGVVTRTYAPTAAARELFTAQSLKNLTTFTDTQVRLIKEINTVYDQAAKFGYDLYTSIKGLRTFKQFEEAWPTLVDDWRSITGSDTIVGNNLVPVSDINKIYAVLNDYKTHQAKHDLEERKAA